MKKLFFAAIIAVFSMTSAFAQDGQFAIGANVGFPMGVAGDAYSLSFGVDANYLFEVSDGLSVGPAVGYSIMTGKKIGDYTVPNLSYIPVAAAGRFNLSDEFVLGLDLGVAFASIAEQKYGDFTVSSQSFTATYYRPMVGYAFGDNLSANAYYSTISKNGSTSSFGVGIMYKL